MSFFTDIIGDTLTPLDFSTFVDYGSRAINTAKSWTGAIDSDTPWWEIPASIGGQIYGAPEDPLRQDSTKPQKPSFATTAPILAAIKYAMNQGPFNTSRLASLYGQYGPQQSAFEYDQNTQTGRQSLTDSLTNRGVAGSVFGENDLSVYDSSRYAGRAALFNQGVQNSAAIAGDILSADIQSRSLKNKMIGNALSIQADALKPKKKPNTTSPATGYQ